MDTVKGTKQSLPTALGIAKLENRINPTSARSMLYRNQSGTERHLTMVIAQRLQPGHNTTSTTFLVAKNSSSKNSLKACTR